MRDLWPYKRLGDVCIIERGGSPRPIEAYITDSPNGLNWIKIGDATEGSKFITSTKEKIKPEGLKKTRFVHKGDFILSNSMSFGKPYISGIDGCIHDGWLVIRDINNVFDKSYLYYVLGSPNMYKEFSRLAQGGVVNNLNTKLVQSVRVAIPPIEVQKRIVAELDLLSGIIEKQKAQLKELDTLAQSIFYNMFGDPVKNIKGWRTELLQDICTRITDGSHFSPKADINGRYPMLSVKDMSSNGFVYDSCKYINESDYKTLVSNGCKPSINDVLVAKDGSYLKTAFVQNTEVEQVILSSIAIVSPMLSVVSPQFLAFFFKTHNVKVLVEKHYLTGTAIKRIILKGFRSMNIILPPLSLQQSFATKIEAIEKQKASINASIAETQKLFDYTMDKYFG